MDIKKIRIKIDNMLKLTTSLSGLKEYQVAYQAPFFSFLRALVGVCKEPDANKKYVTRGAKLESECYQPFKRLNISTCQFLYLHPELFHFLRNVSSNFSQPVFFFLEGP